MQTAGENFPHGLTWPSPGQSVGTPAREGSAWQPPRELPSILHHTGPAPPPRDIRASASPPFPPLLGSPSDRSGNVPGEFGRASRRWAPSLGGDSEGCGGRGFWRGLWGATPGRSLEVGLRGRVLISGEAHSLVGAAQVRCPHSGWPVPPSARQRQCLPPGVGWAQGPGAGLQGPRPSFNRPAQGYR